MTLRRFWLVLILGVLFAGCTTPPIRPLPEDPDAAWRLHRVSLEALDQWRLNGSLAVRSHREGGRPTLTGANRARVMRFRLSGPLGAGGARLSGSENGATLSLGNGDRMSDPDPAQLLHEHLGWWIPVEALRYWALGLPSPTSPAQWSLDPYGRLAALEQQGWRVRFDAYENVDGVDLPGKLSITGEDAEVRLVIRRWTVRVAQAQ